MICLSCGCKVIVVLPSKTVLGEDGSDICPDGGPHIVTDSPDYAHPLED